MQDQREIQLIFDPGRGSVGLRAITAVCGDRVGAMPAATRRGYTFLGWYTAPQGSRGDAHRMASETVVADDLPDSVTLYAHWVKETKDKKRSSLRTQRRAILALGIAAAVLVGGLIFVNYLVQIYHYTDVDNTVYTVKKNDGVYGLYLDGTRCDMSDDGDYFITKEGTLVEIDPKTGAYETFAVVDTHGTEELGANHRVLLFKQLTYDAASTNDMSRIIKRIEVHNEHGTMVFKRPDASEGKLSNYFYIDGHVDTAIDNTLFAQLAVGCGYNLSERRLENPVRLPDGSIDWSEYGLIAETRTREDEEGKEETYEYTPYYYTTTTMTGVTYTVTLGDPTVTGGYYARLSDFNGTGGRDAVYVLTSGNLDNAVLQPVESFVVPLIVFPMSNAAYFNVENFTYYTDIDYDGVLRDMVFDLTDGKVDLDMIDLDAGAEHLPADVLEQMNAAFKEMDEMENDDYKKFCDKHYVANATLVTDFSYNDMSNRENTLQAVVPYVMNNTYMAGYRPNADSITSEVLQNLYEATFEEVIKLAPSDEDLKACGLDDPAHVISFIYHAPTTQTAQGSTQYSLVQFSEKDEETGLYYAYSPIYDMIVTVSESEVPYLEWEVIDWYEREYFQGNILHTTDIKVESPLLEESIHFRLDNSQSPLQDDGIPTLDNLKIFANDRLVSYKLMVTKPVGQRVEETSIYNFQRFFVSLVAGSLEETADLTNEEMAALRAQDDSQCLLKLTIFLDDGTGKEDSTRYLVYRFYQVSERRAYMTLEVLDTPSASSDPSRGQGLFYANTAYCKKIISDVQKYMKGEEILNDSKF